MPLPLLVILTGPPCTGKTSLGRRLAQEFGLPFFYKDGFKESMYDAVAEQSDRDDMPRELSRLLGRFSIDCLKIVAEEMLSKGQSVVIEANFDNALFSPYLMQLKTRFVFHVVQLRLKADGAVLLDRFIRREAEDRHPGHQGMKHLEATQSVLLSGEQEPLEVEGDLLTLDTTDFTQVPYAQIRELLAQRLR